MVIGVCVSVCVRACVRVRIPLSLDGGGLVRDRSATMVCTTGHIIHSTSATYKSHVSDVILIHYTIIMQVIWRHAHQTHLMHKL